MRHTFTIITRVMLFTLILCLCVMFQTTAVMAQPTNSQTEIRYVPLVGIPQLERAGTGSNSLAGYFNNLYLLTIAIGALIAVIKIMIAGVEYSFSEIVTNKQDAKDKILGVLLGLVILLIPFIVLNTIYPGLTKLDILDTASRNAVQLNSRPGATNPGGGNQTNTNNQTNTTNNQTNSGTPANSYTANEVIRPCSFRRTPVSQPTNEFEAAYPIYTYDSSECESRCRSDNGTFRRTGEDIGECRYVQVAPPSTAACQLGGPC